MSDLVLGGSVVARANVNIALVKYWGKAPAHGPADLNLPAVPSLSLTLDGLWTQTRVRFDPDADDDAILLGGSPLTGDALDRARPIFDRVRALADLASPFAVESTNHVPTASGLASSASGAAALAAAVSRCAGLDLDGPALSAVARLGSGSGARSVFPGWAAWEGREARPVAGIDHWDVVLVVAVMKAGPKAISSREAMKLTARTSPLYGGFVASARGDFEAGLAAVQGRDLDALADVMERSALRMHAAAMAADPPVLYWKPSSVAAMEAVRGLRASGLPCGWTMDAGPHVKVLCARSAAADVESALVGIEGVERVLVCGPGSGVTVVVEPDPT
jgi:diphosphomevalonate decarboxylase